jgi:hypothetical protein
MYALCGRFGAAERSLFIDGINGILKRFEKSN